MDLLCGENDDGFSQSDISERPMPSFINFKQGHRPNKAQLFEADLEAVDENDMDLSQDVKTQDAFEPMRCASQSFSGHDDSVLQQSKVKLSMATPQLKESKRPLVNVRVAPLTDKIKENVRLPPHVTRP